MNFVLQEVYRGYHWATNTLRVFSPSVFTRLLACQLCYKDNLTVFAVETGYCNAGPSITSRLKFLAVTGVVFAPVPLGRDPTTPMYCNLVFQSRHILESNNIHKFRKYTTHQKSMNFWIVIHNPLFHADDMEV